MSYSKKKIISIIFNHSGLDLHIQNSETLRHFFICISVEQLASLCALVCKIGFLPPLQIPTVPCHVHVAEEGAVHVSVCGHGGGGECARGACPSSWPVGGTGRWALRGGCEARGTLPSESERGENNTII